MLKKRILNTHRYLKSFIIISFALYIAYLFKHDTLQYYLAPRLMTILKLACLALFLIGLLPLINALRNKDVTSNHCDCYGDCEHQPSRSLFKNSITYGLLILPLLFGFLLPDTAMQSALAAKRGMILTISGSLRPIINPVGASPSTGNLANIPAPPQSQEDYGEFAARLQQKSIIQINSEVFLEELSSINLFPQQFIGKTEVITGFVYREPGMLNTQIVVSRFALQCCSADATPYGVMVSSAHAAKYAEDTWITVTGTIAQINYKGQKIIQLNASKINKITTPKSQYVYPNLAFLDEPL